MKGILNGELIQVKKISPDDEGYYFYGYYDNLAFHPEKKFHLCHRVLFMDRLPKAGEVCQLGVINMETREFIQFAQTKAWNFQQGAMLSWNPANSDEIIYNVFQDGKYKAVIKNLKNNTVRYMDRPVANISPDGKWGLSVNMNRIYDFRPGYGYCNIEDPWKNVNAPAEDGVFLVNMETGTSNQIISYEQLAELYNYKDGQKIDWKITINHITFNRESNRFLFLVRYFPEEGKEWKTGLGTSDLQGNIYKLRNYTYASHYYWGKQGKLLIYADCGAGDGLYELKDESQEYRIFDKKMFFEDIHCSYSPDGQWIIGDGYQDEQDYRPLYLYNIESGKGMVIGRFYSPKPDCTDIRCDLHCRWNLDGKSVSMDSIHEGRRGVYLVELEQAMKHIKEC